jgi:hypothetical protein
MYYTVTSRLIFIECVSYYVPGVPCIHVGTPKSNFLHTSSRTEYLELVLPPSSPTPQNTSTRPSHGTYKDNEVHPQFISRIIQCERSSLHLNDNLVVRRVWCQNCYYISHLTEGTLKQNIELRYKLWIELLRHKCRLLRSKKTKHWS